MARGIIFAMENDDQDLDDIGGVSDAEVASSVNETVSEAGEIEGEVDKVESAVDDTEGLSDVRDKMQESVDSGEGMDETAADIAEVAIECYAKRLGYPYSGRIIPAKESFGGRYSRLESTRVAIEKADNIFVRAWDAIVKTVKKIINRIVEWFRKVFDNSAKLKKASSKMKVEYGDKLMKTAFESSIAKNFTTEGGELSVLDIIKSLSDHESFITKDLTSANVAVKDILKKAKVQVKAYGKAGSKKNDKNEIRAFIIEIMALISSSLSVFNTNNGKLLLWGRKYLNVLLVDASDVGDDLKISKKDGAKGHFLKVETVPIPTNDGGSIAVKAWGSSEGSKLKSATESLANAVVTYSKEIRKFEELQKEILSIIDDLKEMGDGAKKSDAEESVGKKGLEKIMSVFRDMIVDLTTGIAQLNAPVVSSATSMISGVLSLNAENAKCWSKK